MKQAGIGKHAIEVRLRQIELEKILLPHFAARACARHIGKGCCTFQSDRAVAEHSEALQVATRSTAEVEYREGGRAVDRSQQRIDVLCDIVILRCRTKRLGLPGVIVQRSCRNLVELKRFKVLHRQLCHTVNATIVRSGMKQRIPPPALMLLAAFAMWALNHWMPLAAWLTRPWNRMGALPVSLGIAVIVAALLRFRQVETTTNPMDPAKATHLVTEGVFRFSRNPMYLGLLLSLIGWALWLGSASPWIIPPLFVLAINSLQIIPEERILGQLFGPDYQAYRRRVARWMG